jgi:hypothetical protein
MAMAWHKPRSAALDVVSGLHGEVGSRATPPLLAWSWSTRHLLGPRAIGGVHERGWGAGSCCRRMASGPPGWWTTSARMTADSPIRQLGGRRSRRRRSWDRGRGRRRDPRQGPCVKPPQQQTTRGGRPPRRPRFPPHLRDLAGGRPDPGPLIDERGHDGRRAPGRRQPSGSSRRSRWPTWPARCATWPACPWTPTSPQ